MQETDWQKMIDQENFPQLTVIDKPQSSTTSYRTKLKRNILLKKIESNDVLINGSNIYWWKQSHYRKKNEGRTHWIGEENAAEEEGERRELRNGEEEVVL